MALNKPLTAYYTRLGDEYGVKLVDYLITIGVVDEEALCNFWDENFLEMTETTGTDDNGDEVPLPEYPSTPRPRTTPRPHFTS